MATKSRNTVSKSRKNARATGRPALRSAAASRPKQAKDAAATTHETPDTSKASRRKKKVVRDTFTMPAAEFEIIRDLKNRCRTLGVAIKKSELIRAGLAAINKLSDERLTEAIMPVVAARGDDAGASKPGMTS
ncbi:MAG TPA: hypothetical protein VI258_00880 [Rhodanobacteraceae bacterium]